MLSSILKEKLSRLKNQFMVFSDDTFTLVGYIC